MGNEITVLSCAGKQKPKKKIYTICIFSYKHYVNSISDGNNFVWKNKFRANSSGGLLTAQCAAHIPIGIIYTAGFMFRVNLN